MASVSGPRSVSESRPSESLPLDRAPLPQYGFGTELAFEKLLDSNSFLFRVHTPKEPSPFYDKTEPCFVGQLFDDTFTTGNFIRDSTSPSPYSIPSRSTYADAARHFDWTTRSSSPYVSTSFSFAWAIWEATRRYHHGVKHSIEIAVIDARAVSSRAVTAAELLRQCEPKDRHKDHWKWYKFAVEAQDVLVWGYIPGTAVLASVPLMETLSKLPSYFLSPDFVDAKESPLGRLGWDYVCKKPSYRQFCQDMSEQFLRLPADRRLRDTTAGAVRLAVAFLRPHFHKLALDDFTSATVPVCELAFGIASWPGMLWVREHPEIRDLVRCIVHTIAEETREASRMQALADSNRMQDLVGALEQLMKSSQAGKGCRRYLTASTLQMTTSDLEEPASPTIAEIPSETVSLGELEPEVSDAITTIMTTISTNATTVTEKATAQEQRPMLVAESSPESPPLAPTSMESFFMTASCILTGFFFGTLVTMVILSPHRREIANHFT